MFDLKVEIAGRDVQVQAFGSAIAAVRECHSMVREYAAQQEDATVRRGEVDLLFGKGVDQQVRREKFYAASLRGKKPSKTWPNGLPGQPVSGRVGDLMFRIDVAEVMAVVEAEAATAEAAEVEAAA